MINSDLMIGLAAGSAYGYMFKPVFELFFKYCVGLFKLFSSSFSFIAIFSSLLASIGIGGFLITVLFFKPYVIVWKIFISGYWISFIIGALVYAAFHRKQVNKWN
jgi:hypothetical protein